MVQVLSITSYKKEVLWYFALSMYWSSPTCHVQERRQGSTFFTKYWQELRHVQFEGSTTKTGTKKKKKKTSVLCDHSPKLFCVQVPDHGVPWLYTCRETELIKNENARGGIVQMHRRKVIASRREASFQWKAFLSSGTLKHLQQTVVCAHCRRVVLGGAFRFGGTRQWWVWKIYLALRFTCPRLLFFGSQGVWGLW